jgi:hypothetical protein
MGCIAKRKTEAGEGLARLTVRNLGAIVALLNRDTNCGIASDAVQSSAVIVGNPGENGSVTFVVEGCTLNAGAGLVASENCQGDTLTASGAVTVDATLTVSGLLTGDATTPVVPADAESVLFSLNKVTFDNFKVVDSADDNKLTMVDGSLSATVSPRFGVAASSGACAIATPNLTVSDVIYTPTVLFVDTPDAQRDVDIADSKFSAQVGVGATAENTITGTMTVLGREVDVTGDGKLDPGFARADFFEDYACTADLAAPDNFECIDVRQEVGLGSARLSGLAYGTIAGIVQANTACGFSSSNAVSVLSGTPGQDDQTLTQTLTAPCTITFPANTALPADCNGDFITVGGSFTVTGSSVLRGFNTGNALQPIVPESRDPVELSLEIDLNEFSIAKSTTPATLTVHSGTLSATARPRLFLDTNSGVCSVPSPRPGTGSAGLENLSWESGDITLDNNGTLFNFTLDAADISAFSGNDEVAPNSFAGSITLSGGEILVPPGEPLDPEFDPQVARDAFACALPAGVIEAPNEQACSFRQVLGNAAARLIIGGAATMVSVADGACLSNTVVSGTPGQPGSSLATATNCPVTIPANGVNAPDCTGAANIADGTFTLSGSKTTNGLVVSAATVAPLERNDVTFDDISAALNNWRFEKTLSNGNSVGSAATSGTLQFARLTPILGEDDANNDNLGDGIFTKRTPIAKVEGVTLDSGVVTLVVNAFPDPLAGELLLTFTVDITDLNLDALIGAVVGETPNEISGSLTVDGELVTIDPGTAFDDAFTQADLDASYTCDPTVIPVPAN